jgi:hypothetical protein
MLGRRMAVVFSHFRTVIDTVVLNYRSVLGHSLLRTIVSLYSDIDCLRGLKYQGGNHKTVDSIPAGQPGDMIRPLLTCGDSTNKELGSCCETKPDPNIVAPLSKEK